MIPPSFPPPPSSTSGHPGSGARRPAAGRPAFTIVELLVVIGIITILIGILIPVVARVRVSAYTAKTQAQVQRISAAIQNYYNDFQAYPGAVPSSAFGSTGQAASPPAPVANMTQAEDLTLALLGGLKIAGGTVSYDANMVGNGPISLNVRAPGQKAPYMGKVDAELTQNGQASGTYSYMADTTVPEFVDAWPDAMPILYLRTNPGAKAGVNNIVADNYNATVSYNLAAILPYLGAQDGLKQGSANPDVKKYFTSTGDANGTVARGAGSYMLIAAGPDRHYGPDPSSKSVDDIIFVGGGGQ